MFCVDHLFLFFLLGLGIYFVCYRNHVCAVVGGIDLNCSVFIEMHFVFDLLKECQHIEVWVRLHLESRSTLDDWSIMLPDFMYYMTELKDLSYLTQQCNGAQGSAGFPAWGTINKV
ncbi:hypothetical protein L6452_00991 [Arctium lappa]|uniref:Uncharacterized protein n=1 Tax=Arctium lappa TaxID=4217 RepID=A0ACB9FFE8_ARCLA|nr:hypothetical protein L6452_00991 [Arctium lappa]